MRVVVTGARGLIGKSVVEALRCKGADVKTVSRRRDCAVPGCETMVGDLADLEFAREVLKKASHLVHCAGEKQNSTAMRNSNVVATENLVKVAREAGLQRFIHMSSVGVIGYSKEKVIDEDTPCQPMNLYEETKLSAEKLVESSGLAGCILRPANVFGKENMEIWVRLSHFWRWAIGRENAHLVHVGDVAAAVIFALKRNSQSMEKFIVSSDDEVGNTNSEILPLVERRCAHRNAPMWLPYLIRQIRHGRCNYGDKIYSPKRLLDSGFSRPYGLAEGLRLSLDSYCR